MTSGGCARANLLKVWIEHAIPVLISKMQRRRVMSTRILIFYELLGLDGGSLGSQPKYCFSEMYGQVYQIDEGSSLKTNCFFFI